jgi:pimeloyl-ACP methyl ester carboxylesterase
VQLLDASKGIIAVGWSLGGHVALEMVKRSTRIKGIMITGTPPIDGPNEIDEAFTLGPTGWKDAVPARNKLNDEELAGLAHGCADPPYEDWMLDCVTRTDGRARQLMFEHFAEGREEPLGLKYPAIGLPQGQHRLVETSDVRTMELSYEPSPKSMVMSTNYIRCLLLS